MAEEIQDNQKIRKEKRVSLLMTTLRNHIIEKKEFVTINDLAKETNIPRSSIQRYLNDNKLLLSLGVYNDEIELIKEMLIYNKHIGNENGGKHSYENYEPIRDENGHFQGCKKRK